jgi:Uma2 family endonuclease
MATIVESVLPLESGDRLTRAEFHRRYCQHPEITRAELVDGVVYVASPTRFDLHVEQHGVMVTWLGNYALRSPGVRMGDNATVFLPGENEVQPDVLLFRDAPDGSARITKEHYIAGVPDLIVEVAASSASYDLHDKRRVYEREGVPEYLVWRILEGGFDWLRLQDCVYVPVEPDADGIIESQAFPGLRLNVLKLLAGDFAGALVAASGAGRSGPAS